MITDDDVELAVDYLRDNAKKAAEAKANHIYMEEYKKVVKAALMSECGAKTIGERETYAYRNPRYNEHLEVYKEAAKIDEYHRWMMKAAEAKIEVWRTQAANERALGKLG